MECSWAWCVSTAVGESKDLLQTEQRSTIARLRKLLWCLFPGTAYVPLSNHRAHDRRLPDLGGRGPHRTPTIVERRGLPVAPGSFFRNPRVGGPSSNRSVPRRGSSGSIVFSWSWPRREEYRQRNQTGGSSLGRSGGPERWKWDSNRPGVPDGFIERLCAGRGT